MGECAEADFCQHCIEQLQNWNGGISSAMDGWFDDDLIVLVRTSKKAENVESSVNKMIVQTEQWFDLKKQLIIEMLINVLFFAVCLIVLIFVSTNGIEFATQGMQISDYTSGINILLSFGVVVKSKGIALLFLSFALIATLWAAAIYYVGDNRQKMDGLIPFYGFYSASCSSRFYTMLDVLLASSDMPLRKALEELRSSGLVSRYISVHIDEMLYRLKERRFDRGGDKVSSADSVDFDTLDTGLLPSRLRLRLKCIAKSSDKTSREAIMDTICTSLVKDFGYEFLAKVKLYGRLLKIFSALIATVAVVVLLDTMYLKMSLLQMQMY
ncbi:MAG: hypothetical protein MHMPM18_004239 [Marteilia pararefringens]